MQKAACPCLEDSPLCGGLDLCALGGMTTLNILPYQASGGFHYTCVCCCLCPWSQNRNPNILLSAAGGVEGATAPTMDIGSRNGSGGVASLDRGCLHSAPPTIHATARRKPNSAAAAAHVVGSASSSIDPFAPTGEGARASAVRRSYCRAQVGEATVTSAASGRPSSVSIGWISPLVFSP